MKNKFKNWMDKPITNGSIIKMSLVSMAIGVIEVGAIFLGPKIGDKIDEMKEKKQKSYEDCIID